MLISDYGKHVALGALAMSLLALPTSVAAQGRGGVTVSQPGRIRSPGDSSSISDFSVHSYGAGTVGLPGAGGGNVLQSSIHQAGSRGNVTSSMTRISPSRLRSSIGSAAPARRPTATAGSSPKATIMGRPPKSTSKTVHRYHVPGTAGAVACAPAGRIAPQAISGAGRSYLNAVARTGPDSPVEPIRSLASDTGPEPFHVAMAQGEEAFKDGRYHKALRRYLFAASVAPASADAAVALFHGRFATATVSYASPALILTRALRLLPELPTAPLEPHAFYGKPADYLDHRARLDQHCAEHPQDADACLVRAYFLWSEQEAEEAKLALTKVGKFAPEPKLKEAADIFLEGIAASEAADEARTQQNGDPPVAETARPQPPEDASSEESNAADEAVKGDVDD